MKATFSSRVWRALVLAVATLGALVGVAQVAHSHEMTLAEVTMREVTQGQFVWAWGAPGKNKPIALDLTMVWPEGCVGDERLLKCGPKGLSGTLAVDGVGDNYSAAILSITWLGGERSTFTLSKNRPSVRLFGSQRDDRNVWELLVTYTSLGFEHILGGIDHLFFVLSLLFLVGFNRRLIATITAFTVAHSLTLAASALGALTMRPPPVEAVIALSIVLVSAEALSNRDTLTRRLPAIVSFAFGLVHGLGFAGALRDIGLPENNLTVALLGFNLGVEGGQLLVIGFAWVVALSLRRFNWAGKACKLVLYAIGSVSVYWTLARLAVIVAN